MKKRILVIDDDAKHLITTREILEEEGYEVITHHYAFGATNSVREHQPGLVLLDVNMPALSGERLSKVILSNERTKDIPIVFYSSNDEDSLRKAVSEHGVKGYICKGDIFELKKKVAYYLSQNGQKEKLTAV